MSASVNGESGDLHRLVSLALEEWWEDDNEGTGGTAGLVNRLVAVLRDNPLTVMQSVGVRVISSDKDLFGAPFPLFALAPSGRSAD